MYTYIYIYIYMEIHWSQTLTLSPWHSSSIVVYISRVHVSDYMNIYIHMYAYMHIHIHMQVHMFTYVYIHKLAEVKPWLEQHDIRAALLRIYYVYTWVVIYTYIYAYVCVCIYIHIYLHMKTHWSQTLTSSTWHSSSIVVYILCVRMSDKVCTYMCMRICAYICVHELVTYIYIYRYHMYIICKMFICMYVR